MSRTITISLPVADIQRSKAFYSALGFINNAHFTDDTAALMVLSESINVMLLTHAKWRTFTTRPIPPHTSSEVALNVSCDSRESVDAMNVAASENGGTSDINPVQDHGFMYGRDFTDPDGHVWGAMWMDESAINTIKKNTICLWYECDAEEAAHFYARTFPDSSVGAVHRAPADFPGGKAGQVLTVQFTVCGIPCMGLNGGSMFKQNEAFSFQIATDDQAETDKYWDAIVGNGGTESACGWCKDKWGLSWQITPRALTDAMTKGGEIAKRAFAAMMDMRKIDVAKIEAAIRGPSN